MSAKRYPDRQDSKIYGSRLIIHRRPEYKTDFFYFRAKVPGVNGYIRRSCGTDDAARAMLFAESAYEDLLVRHKGGFSLNELTVDKFFYDWIERENHFKKSAENKGFKSRFSEGFYEWF